MLKVNYKLSGLFSLKRYSDSNLKCQSYEYPTVYGIRSAILGAIIQIDGLEKAQELFHKVKNSRIYIGEPKNYKVNGIMQNRYSNGYYSNFDELDRKIIVNSEKTTMGFRQYIHMDTITIYIDNLIPEIEIYLKNIDRLGTSESLCYLESIEEVSELENVLVEWDGNEHIKTYEQWDWGNKAKFENVYMYSDKRREQRRFMSCPKNITLS